MSSCAKWYWPLGECKVYKKRSKVFWGQYSLTICRAQTITFIWGDFSMLCCSENVFPDPHAVWVYTLMARVYNLVKNEIFVGQKETGFLKVRIFWEGHKIWKNLPLKIWHYWVASNFKWKIFSNFVAFSEYSNFMYTKNHPHFQTKTYMYLCNVYTNEMRVTDFLIIISMEVYI